MSRASLVAPATLAPMQATLVSHWTEIVDTIHWIDVTQHTTDTSIVHYHSFIDS